MESPLSACPRCAFALTATAAECARCGVVLAKLERSIDAVEARAAVDGESAAAPLASVAPAASRLDASGRRSLWIGAAITLGVLLVPLTRFVASYMIILVHELGHAACGWLFGYPSVPSFDFAYGGGVTSIEERRIALVVLLYAGWGLVLYALRHRPRGLVAAVAMLCAYAMLAFTNLHEALITFMGHGSELVFAGIFFYRALSGYAVRVPAERPLYAFLAFFIVARDLTFAWGLMTSESARRAYADAKGGGHWMDFSQLAHDFGVPLGSVAGLFLLAAAVTLPLTWLGFRHRESIAAVARHVLASAR